MDETTHLFQPRTRPNDGMDGERTELDLRGPSALFDEMDDEVTPVVFRLSRVRQHGEDEEPTHPFPLTHHLYVGSENALELYTGFDASTARGLFVATYARFEVGTEVDLLIDAFEGYDVFHTRVAWRREATEDGGWPGLGLEIDPSDAPRLTDVVHRVSDAPPIFYPD
jgi:Tfp pilus assembly protein PilZ